MELEYCCIQERARLYVVISRYNMKHSVSTYTIFESQVTLTLLVIPDSFIVSYKYERLTYQIVDNFELSTHPEKNNFR